MNCLSCGVALPSRRTSHRCDVCKAVLRDDWKLGKGTHRAYESNRDASLQRTYGISEADYNRMFLRQSGCCAICGTQGNGKRRLVVDHDHKTGRVRGLLCDPCNKGLGGFRDDTDTLTSAIVYLQRAQGVLV